jgi:Bifunctional DNA primase/polymerase, N-terminal/Primase C terminal 1 (PriCT-1)
LLSKFGNADALGFVLGSRSKITVLDVDTRDEGVLADALSRHGQTPIIIRSGSGHHQAWYRHAGERRDTSSWRARGLPIDILGGGFVVAPPSQGSSGPYQFIRGNLEDLANLPSMKGLEPAVQLAPAIGASAEVGQKTARNSSLWRQCMVLAKGCSTREELLGMAFSENNKLASPLDGSEVEQLANSAWGYEEGGRNWMSGGAIVAIKHSEVDEVMGENPDAFLLLTKLMRTHWGRAFVVANAMAKIMPSRGWTVKRFASARKYLETRGHIKLVLPATRSTPATYAWPNRRLAGQN